MTPEAVSPSGGAGADQAASDAQQGASATPGAPSTTSTTAPATASTAATDGAAGPTGAQDTQAGADGATAAAAQVPETFELVLPEQTALDQTDVEAIVQEAKASGLTTAQAQAALDKLHTQLVAQSQQFRTELEADPEFGGPNLEATQLYAKRALDFAFPLGHPLRQRLDRDMNKSGYGNALHVVAFFARLGKAMSEDQPGARGGQSRVGETSTRSHADRLFGDAQGVVKP